MLWWRANARERQLSKELQWYIYYKLVSFKQFEQKNPRVTPETHKGLIQTLMGFLVTQTKAVFVNNNKFAFQKIHQKSAAQAVCS